MTFSCKTDKKNPETINMTFSGAANNVLSGSEVIFIDSLGAGSITVTLDSVFMSIPTDDIEFSFRKGRTMTTNKGTVVMSSQLESGVFMFLGKGSDGYSCELNTGERLVQFDVETVDQ